LLMVRAALYSPPAACGPAAPVQLLFSRPLADLAST
jgi:hypothetical protein